MAFVRKKSKVYPWPVEVKRPSESVPGEFETTKFIGNGDRLFYSHSHWFSTYYHCIIPVTPPGNTFNRTSDNRTYYESAQYDTDIYLRVGHKRGNNGLWA